MTARPGTEPPAPDPSAADPSGATASGAAASGADPSAADPSGAAASGVGPPDSGAESEPVVQSASRADSEAVESEPEAVVVESASGAVYDTIGRGYAAQRLPEPSWAAVVSRALGDARRVVNVGAGAGSYEPTDRDTVAVEPSRRMIDQRPPGSAPVVQARAEALPVADGAADVALAVLTTHHWSDPAAGLAELRRAAPRQVVLTWDPAVTARWWLVADYLPEIAGHERSLATLDAVVAGLPGAEVIVLPVPARCADGVLGAYWARPAAYLDPDVRQGMSSLALLSPRLVERAMARLAADLRSGAWHRRYGDMLAQASADIGYRLVVAGA